jgi:hypothetical protein
LKILRTSRLSGIYTRVDNQKVSVPHSRNCPTLLWSLRGEPFQNSQTAFLTYGTSLSKCCVSFRERERVSMALQRAYHLHLKMGCSVREGSSRFLSFYGVYLLSL